MPQRQRPPARPQNWITYGPYDHRPCWVWADGQWWPGILRGWVKRDDDQTPPHGSHARWWGTVNWHRADGQQMHQTLPSDRLARRAPDGAGTPPPPLREEAPAA